VETSNGKGKKLNKSCVAEGAGGIRGPERSEPTFKLRI